jgi:hypothetical protein
MDEFLSYGSCGASAMPRNDRGVGTTYSSYHHGEPAKPFKHLPAEEFDLKPSEKTPRRSQRAKNSSQVHGGGSSVASSARSLDEPALLTQLLASGEDNPEGISDAAGDFDDDSGDSDDSMRRKRRRGSTHVPVNYRGVTFVGATSTPWKATINHKVCTPSLLWTCRCMP